MLERRKRSHKRILTKEEYKIASLFELNVIGLFNDKELLALNSGPRR